MRLLALAGPEVHALLDIRSCMEAMERALEQVSSDQALLPLRTVLRLPGGHNLFASMPGGMEGAIGAKVITVFPGNDGARFDSHQGAVLLFDGDTGALTAVMDASAITAIRTAAVSGVATRLLAREDADDIAILGAGVQARSHLAAMREARPVRRVRVWSRTFERALRFATEMATPNLPIEPMASAREAVHGASIVCTTTASREPVVAGEWIANGAHVNAVGAALPTARELDSRLVARSRLYVDRRESALAEAGDFLIPRSEGLFGDEHIVGEIGELLLGTAPGRRSADEVTLFKSLGLAVEDVAAARLLYEKAIGAKAGTWINWNHSVH